jgi:hypothetical protein
LLATDMSSGYSFWQSQLQQWSSWNQQHPGSQVAAASDYWEGNCCVFSMQGSGTYTYDVAIGLKQYAGAAVNFISWYNVNLPAGTIPYWSYNPQNSVAQDIVYQFCTCSSLSTCQHSGAGYPLKN